MYVKCSVGMERFTIDMVKVYYARFILVLESKVEEHVARERRGENIQQ